MMHHDGQPKSAMKQDLTRRQVLKAGGAALMTAAAATPLFAKPEDDPPNIVVITVDDLDFDELSPYSDGVFPCYTHAHQAGLVKAGRTPHFQNLRFLDKGETCFYKDPHMLTPALDRVAAEGIRFDRFYVTSSICTPSRYSIITGRYASRSVPFQEKYPTDRRAAVRWDTFIGASETNLPRALTSRGYRTGHVGKWHLSPKPDGYWQLARKMKLADPRSPETEAILKKAYRRQVEQVLRDGGFDVVHHLYYTNKEALVVPEPMRVHNNAWVAEGAVGFINKSKDGPFYLQMGLTMPHGQYYEDWLHENPRATPAGMLEKTPDVVPDKRDVLRRVREAGIDPRNAMATSIDDAVNAVLESLDRHGLAENTLLVIISDHQSRGKDACYEGNRVPCLMRWPRRIAAGRKNADLFANIDLVPTALAAAGADVTRYPTDGINMLPYLNGANNAGPRQELLLEVAYTRALVTDRWKIIANRPTPETRRKMELDQAQAEERLDRRVDWQGIDNGHWGEEGTWFYRSRDFPGFFDEDQVYDLKADPFEQFNLARERPRVATRLRKRLQKASMNLPHPFPV